jgi:hypothetical protein
MINEISVESGYNNGIICLLQECPLASRHMGYNRLSNCSLVNALLQSPRTIRRLFLLKENDN